MGGGMEANKNKFIEEWGSVRENLEHNFRWTRRNFALVGLFGIAIPIFVYKGIVKEFHMQDEDNGRPYRKFLWALRKNAVEQGFSMVNRVPFPAINKLFALLLKRPFYFLLELYFAICHLTLPFVIFCPACLSYCRWYYCHHRIFKVSSCLFD